MNIFLYTTIVVILSVFLSTILNLLIMKQVVEIAAKIIEKMHKDMLGLINKVINKE